MISLTQSRTWDMGTARPLRTVGMLSDVERGDDLSGKQESMFLVLRKGRPWLTPTAF